jgi:hypothetical protein
VTGTLAGVIAGRSFASTGTVLAGVIAAGLTLEGIGLLAHARYLRARGAEAAASLLQQRTTFGYTDVARTIGLGAGLVAALFLMFAGLDGAAALAAWSGAAVLIGVTATVGRALFYVLVVPTTMPGAFFWRNAAFAEHARESGLANMPQVGVLPRTEYHDLQLQRAARDIKNDLAQLGKRDAKAERRPAVPATETAS